MTELAVSARGLSRKYDIYARPSDRLKEMIFHRSCHEEFWAVRELDLDVPKGQTLGLVGANGSGKSTLLQLLSGVLHPTTGSLKAGGRMTALLELGAGFNPEFSGRQNVFLNGAVLGLSDSEIRQRFDAIAAFAEIGDFIEQPVKTYSSGMYVRLAFAVAVNVDPEILIVDEALAVGDARFQHRCMLKMAEMQERGVSIIFVSHDLSAVKRLCQRVLWLEHGRVVADGDPETVTERYLHSLFGHSEVTAEAACQEGPSDLKVNVAIQLPPPSIDRRFGNGDAELVGVGVFNKRGELTSGVTHGEPFELRVEAEALRHLARPIVGFILRDRLGTDITASNTSLEGSTLAPLEPGDRVSVSFQCTPPMLAPGSYSFTIAIGDGDVADNTMNDWVDNALILQVVGQKFMYGLLRFPIRCSVQTSEGLTTTGSEYHPQRL